MGPFRDRQVNSAAACVQGLAQRAVCLFVSAADILGGGGTLVARVRMEVEGPALGREVTWPAKGNAMRTKTLVVGRRISLVL